MVLMNGTEKVHCSTVLVRTVLVVRVMMNDSTEDAPAA